MSVTGGTEPAEAGDTTHQEQSSASPPKASQSGSSNPGKQQATATATSLMSSTRKHQLPTPKPTIQPNEASQATPMPLELYKMIGDNAPMLSMSVGGRRKRAKLDDGQGDGQKYRWEWREFTNPARKDGLALRHWEKVDSKDPDAPYTYPFSKYDVTTNVYSYSTDEYISHLRDESGDWSKDETDYLFSLCHEYDLRWFVIKDRWNWQSQSEGADVSAPTSAAPAQEEVSVPAIVVEGEKASEESRLAEESKTDEQAEASTSSVAEDANKPKPVDETEQKDGEEKPVEPANPSEEVAALATVPATTQATSPSSNAKPKDGERTMEELKDRYYSVCRKLIRARPAGDEAAKAALLHSYGFEKERDSARKQHLANVLLKLSPEQLQEEEFLYIESRRLEQTYAKTARDREDLWRLLGGVGPQSSLSAAGPNGLSSSPFFGPGTLSGANSANKDGKKRRRGEVDFLEDAPSGTAAGSAGQGVVVTPQLTPEQDVQFGITRYDGTTSAVTRPSGVYLRSSKPPQLKTSLAPKILTHLAELQISMRLAMPTRSNMEKLEGLTGAITNLLDTRKQVERAEYELKILKTRKEAAARVEEEDRQRALAEKKEGDKKDKDKDSDTASNDVLTPQPDESGTMQVDG